MSRVAPNGPATSHVLDRLRAAAVLAGEQVTLAPALLARLPDLGPALQALGCTVVEAQDAEADGAPDGAGPAGSAAIRLGRSQAPIDMRLVPADDAAPGTGAPRFGMGDIPMVALLARRRLCDYAIWERLLCGPSPAALSGKLLVVDGYCDVGRVIAHKARGLGLVVSVRDPAPRRRIEALYDGFDLASEDGADGEEREQAIEVPVRDLVAELASHAAWERALAGIEDEMTAACLIAIAVRSHQLRTDHGGHGDAAAWHTRCEDLVCDALLRARTGTPGLDPAVWDTSRW